jgi:hypothetical protein
MRIAAILLVFMGAVCVAQRHEFKPQPDAGPAVKQLESVTWDLKTHKLSWVVQNGKMANGRFESQSSDKYEISPNDAVMAFSDQRRGFSPQEAAGVQKLLDTLSLYCAESVIWWDHGDGVKLDGSEEKDTERNPPKRRIPAGVPIALR